LTPHQVIPSFDSLNVDAKWNAVKSIRNDLLLKSDWTQLVDVSLSPELRQEWKDYRQQLRGITATFTNPDHVVFPDSPNAVVSTDATLAEQIEAVELMIDLILDTQQESA
jgi:hypothetical protein